MDENASMPVSSLTTLDLQINQKEIFKNNRKIILLQKGFTQTALAAKLKVTLQAVNNELRGSFRSEKIRLGICELIQVSKEIFWPEFYSLEDEPGKNEQHSAPQ